MFFLRSSCNTSGSFHLMIMVMTRVRMYVFGLYVIGSWFKIDGLKMEHYTFYHFSFVSIDADIISSGFCEKWKECLRTMMFS